MPKYNVMKRPHRFRSHATTVAAAVVLASTLAGAQTRVAPPDNNYTPAQDVEMGRQAAADARKTLPLMRDDNVTSFVQDTGRRLVAAIPAELQHPGFQYTFEVVNVKEINAFALPGGPMFVNRGMIEAARTDGEVAGVMAHELSHVLLRHGTAQASKATKYEVGQVAGAVLGAIIGGGWGQVISQGTQFGLGTAFLRFSREYERQADIEGAQIMARAGRGARQTPAAGWDCQRGVSIRPHRASRLTPKATCSASACRRTGGSGRTTNAVPFAPPRERPRTPGVLRAVI